MYKHKNISVKKGYVTVYILLISFLCMTLVLYSFYLEVKKARNIKSYKNLITNAKKIDEYREHLFTYFHKELNEALRSRSKESVKEYLNENNIKFKFDNDKSCIRYDSNIDKIVLETYYDSDYYRRDLYDYKIISNKLIYVYLKTTYVKGRIQ